MIKARDEAVEDLNGPLDLILRLLSKNRMEIEDIQTFLILDRYLGWMDQRKQLDPGVAGKFATMAVRLVLIKTRMLLSIHDEEAISEMEQSTAFLKEHQRHENSAKIKTIVLELSDRYAIGRGHIPEMPETLPANRTYRYVHKSEDLLRAMTTVLTQADHYPPPLMTAFEGIVGRELYPVTDKTGEVLEQLSRFGVARFRALFKDSRSRSEVVATFITVLKLCKTRRLRLAGTEGDYTVTYTEEGGGKLELTIDGEKATD